MKNLRHCAQKQLDAKKLHGFKTLKTSTPGSTDVAATLGAKIGVKRERMEGKF